MYTVTAVFIDGEEMAFTARTMADAERMRSNWLRTNPDIEVVYIDYNGEA